MLIVAALWWSGVLVTPNIDNGYKDNDKKNWQLSLKQYSYVCINKKINFLVK